MPGTFTVPLKALHAPSCLPVTLAPTKVTLEIVLSNAQGVPSVAEAAFASPVAALALPLLGSSQPVSAKLVRKKAARASRTADREGCRAQVELDLDFVSHLHAARFDGCVPRHPEIGALDLCGRRGADADVAHGSVCSVVGPSTSTVTGFVVPRRVRSPTRVTPSLLFFTLVDLNVILGNQPLLARSWNRRKKGVLRIDDRNLRVSRSRPRAPAWPRPRSPPRTAPAIARGAAAPAARRTRTDRRRAR